MSWEASRRTCRIMENSRNTLKIPDVHTMIHIRHALSHFVSRGGEGGGSGEGLKHVSTQRPLWQVTIRERHTLCLRRASVASPRYVSTWTVSSKEAHRVLLSLAHKADTYAS